ncbi:MAG: InlB B-repeat-containing protein [Methanosarcinales archaeon]|nr:InlB B-repeat-containing protein [Methanosarcinales archaeon]
MSAVPAFVSAVPSAVTVTYYSNGTQYSEETVNYGEPVSAPLAPAVPAGMTSFIGWSAEINGPENLYDFSVPVSEDLNLFAQFSDKYLISFKDAGGDIYYTRLVEADGYAVPPKAPPSGTDDVFVYWVIDNTYDMYDFSLPVNSNIVLRPVYDNSYYIYFNSMKGMPVEKQFIGAGEKADEPEEPLRAGYNFVFWSTKMDADPNYSGNAYDFSAPIDESLTLYAIWKPDELNKPEVKVIVWNEKEGLPLQFDKMDPKNYVYYDSFVIWELAGSTVEITESEMNQSYDYYIPAHSVFYRSVPAVVEGDGTTAVNVYYTNKIYTLFFNLNDTAAEMTDRGQSPEMTYTNSANPEEQHSIEVKVNMPVEEIWPLNGNDNFSIYKTDSSSSFQGWMIPLGLNDATGSSSYMIWVSKRMTVTAEMLPDSSYGNGSETGFTLDAYWISNGQDTGLRYMFEALPDEEKTGDAGVDYIEYGGKVYMNSTYSQIALSDGSAFKLKSIEGRTAVTEYALGFNDSSAELEELTGMNFTQYLIYDRMRFSLDFDTMGGSSISGETDIMSGEKLSTYVPAAPTRADYIFVGWYEDREYQKPYDLKNSSMPNRNLELFAKWERAGVTASFFDQDGGTLLGVQNLEYGGSVRPPANTDPYFLEIGTPYENSGIFKGWYQTLSNRLVVPYTFSNSIEKDVEIYGLYKTSGFRVTYDENGGTGKAPTDEETYKLNVLAPVKNASLQKESMILAGWQKIDSTGVIYYPGSTIKMYGNVDFEAVYAHSDSLVNLVYNTNYDGSTETKTDTVIEGRSYALRDDRTFKRSGYVLTGWSETPGATVPQYACGGEFLIPDGGASLYATWEEVQYFTVTFEIRDSEKHKGEITSQYEFKVEKGAPSVQAIPVAVRPSVDIIPDANGEYKYRFTGWDALPTFILKDLIVYANFENLERGGGSTGGATVVENMAGAEDSGSQAEDPMPGYETPLPPENPPRIIGLFLIAVGFFTFVRKQDQEE